MWDEDFEVNTGHDWFDGLATTVVQLLGLVFTWAVLLGIIALVWLGISLLSRQ